jgi:hypothetical protein
LEYVYVEDMVSTIYHWNKSRWWIGIYYGSDVNNFREWNTAGSDYGSYPYGGWQNFAVNPE